MLTTTSTTTTMASLRGMGMHSGSGNSLFDSAEVEGDINFARLLQSENNSLSSSPFEDVWRDFNDSVPTWAVWSILIVCSFVLVCCCTVTICMCVTSRQRRRDNSLFTRYVPERDGQGAARAKARLLNKKSKRVMRFMASDEPQLMSSNSSYGSRSRGEGQEEIESENADERSSVSMASSGNASGRPSRVVSRRQPEAYGRIDKATQERIQSIRASTRLQPILPRREDGGNAKALRMMGVSEESTRRNTDASIEERMRKLAQGAGGGVYSTGFSTAKFGDSIADGFVQLRARKSLRQSQVIEAQRQQPRQKPSSSSSRPAEFSSVRLKSTASTSPTSGNASTPKPSKPAAADRLSVVPNSAKLQQFLARQESSSSGDIDADGEDSPKVQVKGGASLAQSASFSNSTSSSAYGSRVDSMQPGGGKLTAFLRTSTTASTLQAPNDSDADESDADNESLSEHDIDSVL